MQTSPTTEAETKWRHRVEKSITFENAKDARDELRTLSLEREILSDAIRHLYEAHAEGKITEEEIAPVRLRMHTDVEKYELPVFKAERTVLVMKAK